MAITAAERQARFRARRRYVIAAKSSAGDGEAALLELLRSYHRAGAVDAADQIRKQSAHLPDVAQLADATLAEFDRQMALSTTDFLNFLKDDGRRRWIDLFAQVSDRQLSDQTPCGGQAGLAARPRLRTPRRP